MHGQEECVLPDPGNLMEMNQAAGLHRCRSPLHLIPPLTNSKKLLIAWQQREVFEREVNIRLP